MELTDLSGYFAGPGMLGGSFGDASRASDEAAEGVADPAWATRPTRVFYELTRKFVETEEDVPRRPATCCTTRSPWATTPACSTALSRDCRCR
ncbi:MAG: hypothetical protein ACLUQW_03395 [Collinsella sp.]